MCTLVIEGGIHEGLTDQPPRLHQRPLHPVHLRRTGREIHTRWKRKKQNHHEQHGGRGPGSRDPPTSRALETGNATVSDSARAGGGGERGSAASPVSDTTAAAASPAPPCPARHGCRRRAPTQPSASSAVRPPRPLRPHPEPAAAPPRRQERPAAGERREAAGQRGRGPGGGQRALHHLHGRDGAMVVVARGRYTSGRNRVESSRGEESPGGRWRRWRWWTGGDPCGGIFSWRVHVADARSSTYPPLCRSRLHSTAFAWSPCPPKSLLSLLLY